VTGAGQALVDFSAALKRQDDARPAGTPSFVPPSANIRELLEECLRVCKASMKDEPRPPGGPLDPARPPVDPPGGPSTPPGTDGGHAPFAGSTIETRRQAIETLTRVADFFRRTEPHSPISYGIDQVVRWGRMSLPELLVELVSDKSAREEIFKRAGIAQESNE
jgi:type VI secretion system protein ImpA